MKQLTLSLDSETMHKLKRISDLSGISQVEIVRNWVSESSKLIDPNSTRITFGSYVVEGKNVVVTRISKLEIGTCPDEDISTQIRKKFEGEKT